MERRADSDSEDELEIDEYHIESQTTSMTIESKGRYSIILSNNGDKKKIDWQTEVDRLFEVIEVPGSNQVKMVAIPVKSTTFVWWDSLVAQRSAQCKEPIL